MLDHVYTLNPDTPTIRCEGKSGVSPDVVFGIDTKLFGTGQPALEDNHDHMKQDLDAFSFTAARAPASAGLLRSHVEQKLNDPMHLPKDQFYRIKGFVWLREQESDQNDVQLYIINWAFGRFDLTLVTAKNVLERHQNQMFSITTMGRDLLVQPTSAGQLYPIVDKKLSEIFPEKKKIEP